MVAAADGESGSGASCAVESSFSANASSNRGLSHTICCEC